MHAERHLKLAAALKDPKAQLDASEILGVLANDSGQFAEATSYFEQSRILVYFFFYESRQT